MVQCVSGIETSLIGFAGLVLGSSLFLQPHQLPQKNIVFERK